MADENDDFLDDDSLELDNAEDTFSINTSNQKLDARRRLEEYMEMKKLRELTEF
ncbi:MAG: hypothetical protein PVJ63_02670 [Thioalkalispiraceae bacterium]|jgi:hypothetical protein